jgi:hypothetical protein
MTERPGTKRMFMPRGCGIRRHCRLAFSSGMIREISPILWAKLDAIIVCVADQDWNRSQRLWLAYEPKRAFKSKARRDVSTLPY